MCFCVISRRKRRPSFPGMIAGVFNFQKFSNLSHFNRMLELTVFLILCLVFNGECTPRPFYHSAMCQREGSTDCSFQMTDKKNSICKVYNTSECNNFDFSGWVRQAPEHPMLQSDSVYTIAVSPYSLTVAQGQSQLFAALNITLTTSDKDVDGYVLLLENSNLNVNICRIFDFRNSSSQNTVTLFYDCLFSLISYGTPNFDLKVRVLPHNEEMLYTLFLPDTDDIEADDICLWKPLVMVFNGGLQNNTVEVKFSQAPKHLNILSYEVSLVSKESYMPVQNTIIDATENAFINAMFSQVDRGFYCVSVRPMSSISSQYCGIKRYTVFFVENKIIDKVTISYILAICFTGVLLVIIGQLFSWWLFKPGPITFSPVVLLVYSYDYKEHDVNVLKFAKFLENQCGMKILTIYGEQRNDLDLWLLSTYRNCDVVMIIISEGVLRKCENAGNPPMKEGYPCGDRLIPTMSFLKPKMLTNEKRFIQVYFEYSGTCQFPSFMHLGKLQKTFMIPREMNRLLCQVYNQNPKIECLGVYPRMPGHDLISSPEGMALIESIEEMKQVLQENQDVLHTKNERHIPPTSDQVKVRNTDSEISRQPENYTANLEKKYLDYDLRKNFPSKQCHSNFCYSNGHMCDEENCADSYLLQNTESCTVAEYELDPDFNKQSIQKNSVTNELHDNEQISADRHLQDLEYILSKPGPSVPYFNVLKPSK